MKSPLECTPLRDYGCCCLAAGLRASDTGANAWETLPLATLEGEGSFRRALAAIALKNQLRLNIEVECASFPMVARAVAVGVCNPAKRGGGGPGLGPRKKLCCA